MFEKPKPFSYVVASLWEAISMFQLAIKLPGQEIASRKALATTCAWDILYSKISSLDALLEDPSQI
jgi:hypothetical protein